MNIMNWHSGKTITIKTNLSTIAVREFILSFKYRTLELLHCDTIKEITNNDKDKDSGKTTGCL